MLPEKITQHPFFHNKQEKEIKQILMSQPNGTCLFSVGKNENELFLWYTALFKGQKQVRSYSVKDYSAYNSLYEMADFLKKFLDGFADSESNLIVNPIKTMTSQKNVFFLLQALSNGLTSVNHIFHNSMRSLFVLGNFFFMLLVINWLLLYNKKKN